MDMSMTSTPTSPQEPQQQHSYHLLRLHFPDIRLLPQGRRPYLEIPKDTGYREEPRLGSYHLDASNLSYFTRFEVDRNAQIPSTTEADDLSAHVARLAEAPGTSDLHVVSYVREDDIITNIRLFTNWTLTSGRVWEGGKDFELSSADWHTCVSLARSEPSREWIRLVNDLMTAESDRAYLHRRHELERHNQAWIDREEASWPVTWDEMPLDPANQLLANHLELMFSDPDGSEAYAPMVSLGMYNDNDRLDVRLPCDHTASVLVGLLKQLSNDDCASMRCEHSGCGKRILTRQDDHELSLSTERVRRVSWAFDAIQWERLDTDVQDSSGTVNISSTGLFRRIELMLDTFRVPESTSPDQLCPTKYAETIAIVRHLRSILTVEKQRIAMTPRSFLAELQNQAVIAVKEHRGVRGSMDWVRTLPPSFESFLQKWLTRVVNHVVGSKARNESRSQVQDIEALAENFGKVEIQEKSESGKSNDWDEMLPQESDK